MDRNQLLDCGLLRSVKAILHGDAWRANHDVGTSHFGMQVDLPADIEQPGNACGSLRQPRVPMAVRGLRMNAASAWSFPSQPLGCRLSTPKRLTPYRTQWRWVQWR